MDEVSFRGGSRIGWVNASWPFARLTVSRDRLVLHGFGRHEFTPEQVVAFGSFGSIPLFANGLAIEHNRTDCPARVVFWCLGSRQRVFDEIHAVGFVPSGQPVARPGGMPFRWSFAIAVVLAWNALLLADGAVPMPWHPSARPNMPGAGALAALVMVFLLATGIKAVPALQRLALAPGHAVGEVRGLLGLLQLVSAFIGAIFTLIHFCGPG